MYVQGEYKSKIKNSDQTEKEPEPETSEMKPIEIVHGYSRDHRPDLKQFIRPLAKKICVILKSLLNFRSNFELLG